MLTLAQIDSRLAKLELSLIEFVRLKSADRGSLTHALEIATQSALMKTGPCNTVKLAAIRAALLELFTCTEAELPSPRPKRRTGMGARKR